MITILKLTKKQLETIQSDCRTVMRNLSSESVTSYYERQLRIVAALYEVHALDYTQHREMLADLKTTYNESMKFAELNDQLAR